MADLVLPEPSAAPPPKEPDSLSLLRALTEASAVLVSVAFVGGWSYLASYYRTFGLNPLEWDIPIPVVATLAVHMMYELFSGSPLGAILVGCAAVAAAFALMRVRNRWAHVVFAVALGALLLGASTVGLLHGRTKANSDMLFDSDTLPNVAFASTKESRGPSCVGYQAYGAMAECRLLLHLNGAYYFFQPLPHDSAGNLELFMLTDPEVLGVHIQRGLDREVIGGY